MMPVKSKFLDTSPYWVAGVQKCHDACNKAFEGTGDLLNRFMHIAYCAHQIMWFWVRLYLDHEVKPSMAIETGGAVDIQSPRIPLIGQSILTNVNSTSS